jgi:hypothetical protein
VIKILTVVSAILFSTVIASGGVIEDPAALPMRFEVKSDRIVATGVFRNGDTPKLFQELIDKWELEGTTIEFDSYGGHAEAAMLIGRKIRQLKMNTLVNKDCFSMCPFVFAAGINRTLGPAARIGVHQPYVAERGGASEADLNYDAFTVNNLLKDMSKILRYSREMGVPKLMERALTVHSWGPITPMTKAEIRATGLLK